MNCATFDTQNKTAGRENPKKYFQLGTSHFRQKKTTCIQIETTQIVNCVERKIVMENDEKLRVELGNSFDLIRFKEMDGDARNKRLSLYKDMFSKDEIIEICTQKENYYNTIRGEDIVFEFIKPKFRSTADDSFRFRVPRDMKLISICSPICAPNHDLDEIKKCGVSK